MTSASYITANRRADLPSSPWAERFPYNDYTYVENAANHSSLAPVYPRIDDAKYYDIPPSDTRAPGDSKEFDRLFWHESLQVRELLGIRTWEAAVLKRRLHLSNDVGFISGGHTPPLNAEEEEATLLAYSRDKIKVDEAKWAPFLRKERWFDWAEGDSVYGDWSVEDPAVWDSITTSIELANRMLAALLEERNEGEQRIAKAERKEKTPWDWAVTKTVQESTDRLIKLLKNVVWGLLPTLDSRGALGVTYSPATTMNDYTFISLSVELVERLKDTSLSLAERCEAQVLFSVLLIHELMHAILLSREYPGDNDYAGNRWNRSVPPLDEPYLNAAGINEGGAFMEQALFGGLLRTYPLLSPKYWKGQARPFPRMLASAMKEFPDGESLGNAVVGSASREAGATTTVYHMPLVWHSRLLSEQFWARSDPKSANFFHRSVYLYGQHLNEVGNAGPSRWRQPEVQMSSAQNREIGDQEFGTDFEERRLMWKSAREGWYDEAKRTWDNSPWQNQLAIERYQDFAKAFASRDEILCANIAESLALSVRWDKDERSYREDLPSPDGVAGRNWAWHVLGLLMMASMPIRRQPRSEERKKQVWRELEPSRTAAAGGYSEDVIFIDRPRPITSSVKASLFYRSDGESGWQSVAPRLITQKDYLDAAKEILVYIRQSGAFVHLDFYDALVGFHKRVSDIRDNLEYHYGTASANEWAPDWDFQLPEYNPAVMAFNTAEETWVPQA
ncbi:hypothetical protein F5Y16DRAFT_405316 [Xylariaceae sp. FL0255]|nr:hypothetical protein F5Y16DRAFT_405316 [Xylariaceae sp. FL0255]